MKRYVIVRCRDGKTFRNEIDENNRIIIGKVGNVKSIHRKLMKRVESEEDVRKIYQIISVQPIDSVEFFNEE